MAQEISTEEFKQTSREGGARTPTAFTPELNEQMSKLAEGFDGKVAQLDKEETAGLIATYVGTPKIDTPANRKTQVAWGLARWLKNQGYGEANEYKAMKLIHTKKGCFAIAFIDKVDKTE